MIYPASRITLLKGCDQSACENWEHWEWESLA
jgi:hypothetical protein